MKDKDPMIVFCNYTLVVVPDEYVEHLKLPSTDLLHRKAKKYIKKFPVTKRTLVIDLNTGKPYHDPNTNLTVNRHFRDFAGKYFKNGQRLFIRDIEVIKHLSKPNKNGL